MKTVCCVGTGPSLTNHQIETARRKGFTLFACNNAIFEAKDAALLYACNDAWWDWYWPHIWMFPCEKWTTNKLAAEKYSLNWIAEKFMWGLSEDPDVISHGHGSGFSLVSMAHRAGADRIVLLGFDLKYAPDYDGKTHNPGSTPRHFFGEYPEEMQHWPSEKVEKGIHVELRDLYRAVAKQGLVEIINCTPDSAIDCFPMVDIEDL